MKQDGVDGRIDLAGVPPETAVEAVLDRDDAPDRATAETLVESLTEDGVVSRAAFDELLEETSMTISTSETRTEFARIAFDETAAAISDGPDLAVAESRLAGFRERLDALETAVEALGEDLQAVLDGVDDDAVPFAAARRLEELRSRATDCQRQADECSQGLETLEQWATTPAVRWEELAGDVDAIAAALNDVEAAVDVVVEDLATVQGDAPSDGVASRWFDHRSTLRVHERLLADLRFELADLRANEAAGDRAQGDDAEDLEARLDDLADRRTVLQERLEAAAPDQVLDRYADRWAALEAAVATFDPPIDWGELTAAVDSVDPGTAPADGEPHS